MENKKTTELLDMLWKLTDKDGNQLEGYDEVREELESREPFYSLLHPYSELTASEEIEELKGDIKRLSRHKHDERTGDVMIRI